MARKRTADQEQIERQTAIAPAQDGPVTGENEQRPETAHRERIAALREPGDEIQRKPFPNPHEFVTDNLTGVRFRTADKPYQTEIVFRDGKPSAEVRDLIKDNGFQWNIEYKAWVRPVRFTHRSEDHLTARRLAHQVIDMIREEKGLEPQRAQVQAPF